MENMVDKVYFNNIYKGRRVLVTGHTGFKGSWLVLWLKKMGAEVMGYSLEAPSQPNHMDLLNLDINSVIGDILDEEKLDKEILKFQPEIVFHMAAQALVRESYTNPVWTYKTNVIGTINLFEACRKCESVKVIINITSDKCYSNKEWVWGYRETDPMGGYDPYSSSKGCSEILTESYRNSFFNKKGEENVQLASVRAGNVIGGGDWAKDRLIPDMMRAISTGKTVEIRNPKSTRPWQLVLEPLSGYLLLASELFLNKKGFADGWNFGPLNSDAISVITIVQNVKKLWDKLNYKIEIDPNQPHEANYLKLDCSKANTLLGWTSILDSEMTLQFTTEWYKAYYEEQKVLSDVQITNYINEAIRKKAVWVK